jgi:hypothetical protein
MRSAGPTQAESKSSRRINISRNPKHNQLSVGRRRSSRRLRSRRGLSAMEVVITLGVTFPIAMALYFLGRDACARLFYIVDSLVSWPFL